MGIVQDNLFLAEQGCSLLGKDLKKIKMCELGNQHFQRGFTKHKTGKECFSFNGIDHTSIDINGLDGALPFDLSKPLLDFKDKFDIVTNYGTTEHVSNQYEVFKNIHNFIREDGIIVGVSPLHGSWKGHCTFRYHPWFFSMLAEENNYKVYYYAIKKRNPARRLLYSHFYILGKSNDKDFITLKQFNSINGISGWNK